ncbi:NfeD family protein [Variovorax sp. YR216]|uniref:NfeD family protein n=1 Tax=Variovorax sp. YR216 TaxID=1882828 RepID=UPI00089A55E8|nr:NfeD family protein [Variovorax sp. YR216]SEA05546.1 Membrane protein implicated in regulation of membrane protease activity [Variovorax sp. YR216]
MASSTVWWLMTGAAIVLELISGTGTVYLLLIGAGFAAAAVSTHLGASLGTQFIVAAVVSVSAVIVWHAIRRRRPPGPPTSANPDVNMDIGERVQVDAWNADGTAVVRYRGTQWTAVARAGDVPTAGQHKVVEVVGSRLVVEKI